MSKYTQPDIIEEEGIKILKSNLHANFFLINDNTDNSGKDKCSDIDGQIRLRDGNGNYKDSYLHYQTKSHQIIRNPKKYPLNRKIINYLVSTNVPTLFFVVEVSSKKCYWFFITPEIKKEFNLHFDKKGRSIDLTKGEIKENESQSLNTKWEKFARKNNYEKDVSELNNIVDEFKVDIQSCLGLLYLFGFIKKQEWSKICTNLLNIEEHKSKTIIECLEKKDIISSTVNYYLLENEKLGIESLFLLLDNQLLNLENLNKHLLLDDKKTVFKQLSKIKHKKIDKYFNKLSKEFLNYLPKFENNNDIYWHLELLEEYIYRIPNQAFRILKQIINPQKVLKVKNWKGLEGFSHSDLIKKSIELLDSLRYEKTKDVFSLLLELSNSEEKSIQEKACESLGEIAKYDLFEKIGYEPQVLLLNEIEAFGNKKLLTNIKAVSIVLKEIIKPSFEESGMKDYKTVEFYNDGLEGSSKLKEIRQRAINILKTLFLLSKEISQKKETLSLLEKATELSLFSSINYTNDIIQFYCEEIKNTNNEIVQEIEKQSHSFIRMYSKELKDIEKLQSLIAQNNDYNVFKILVGYDSDFNESLDWERASKERQLKIQEFVEQISDSNFDKWQNKIISIISAHRRQPYSDNKYSYFHIFLNKLGKQKPKIAYRLIKKNEAKLEEFILHLIAGIYISKEKNIAIKFIEDSIKKGKFLYLWAYIFSYVKEIDENLLKKVFQQAKKKKDVKSLNNIIRSIVDNYTQDKKHSRLFIETIKELTKLKDYWWIDNVWYQEKLIEILPEKDFDVILNNLLLVPKINHHAETILEVISKNNPLKIIKFFEKRMSIQKKGKESYHAIPFAFPKLGSVLQQHVKNIIPEIIKWFKKQNGLFKYDVRGLLNHYSINDFDCELIKLINTGEKKNIKVVFSIFDAYAGDLSLESKAVQTLIRKYSDYHDRVICCMSVTKGVVVGENGFVDSLNAKKEAVQKWKKDKKRYIQDFVKKYEDYLDKEIDYEKKRANEKLELTKRGYR